ncbi:hypothetical protein K440DRAFT_634515 [Wilcoxina mikolae CBS 423.85]|nr:hypothetical protein K440DRAFT_634515 [Wilcoxina mikolae CBS 423.85]
MIGPLRTCSQLSSPQTLSFHRPPQSPHPPPPPSPPPTGVLEEILNSVKKPVAVQATNRTCGQLRSLDIDSNAPDDAGRAETGKNARVDRHLSTLPVL